MTQFQIIDTRLLLRRISWNRLWLIISFGLDIYDDWKRKSSEVVEKSRQWWIVIRWMITFIIEQSDLLTSYFFPLSIIAGPGSFRTFIRWHSLGMNRSLSLTELSQYSGRRKALINTTLQLSRSWRGFITSLLRRSTLFSFPVLISVLRFNRYIEFIIW